MNTELAIRIQVEVMNGRTWDTRSAAVPDTDEAHELWDRIAAELAAGSAKGWVAEVPNELPI